MRLFVAVRPPPQALGHLAAALGRDPDERWHVTLAFLGEQPTAAPFDLTGVATGLEPFRLRLAGATRLGSTVATRLEGDLETLQLLAGRVREACRAAGARIEQRPYRPHLTVGHGRVPAVLRKYVGPDWLVTDLELVHSVLGRPVAHHVLSTFRLGSDTLVG